MTDIQSYSDIAPEHWRYYKGCHVHHYATTSTSTWQARHVGWFERVARPPPPPPCDHKAENLPQQHPPESAILHQFAAKNKNKIPGGMPPAPDPPNMTFPFAQLRIAIQTVFYRGPINLFRKYPGNLKFDPPFKNFWARACMACASNSRRLC